MIKIALLGSLEPIYGLLWLTYNEIGFRQKLISGYIICIIFLFLHNFIPVVWVGGRPKGLPKMTEYQSNPPCRFKASKLLLTPKSILSFQWGWRRWRQWWIGITHFWMRSYEKSSKWDRFSLFRMGIINPLFDAGWYASRKPLNLYLPFNF